jgi:phosphatidate cytidylyltransferase
VTRFITAIVLLPLVVGVIWYGPPVAALALVGLVVTLAFVEYARLVRRAGEDFPAVVSGAATGATFASVSLALPLELVLVPALFVTGLAAIARGRPDEDVLRRAAVTLFPAAYLGLPMGLAVSLRTQWSAAVLLLPFLAIVVSDSSQYYAGRLMGRTPLAPAISPKKTVEGAVAGILATAVFMPVAGRYVLPGAELGPLVALGLLVAGAGIAGDLFESLLKRSSGIKDSSALIPGHGGVLDRIDAMLFACPAFYVFLVSAGW